MADAFDWCYDHIETAQTALLFRYALQGCPGRFWSSVVRELLARREWDLAVLKKLQWQADINCEVSVLVTLDNLIRDREKIVVK